MKILTLTAQDGRVVCIPIEKIIGFTETVINQSVVGNTYIGTGPESEDFENGWYVKETWREVYALLEASCGT